MWWRGPICRGSPSAGVEGRDDLLDLVVRMAKLTVAAALALPLDKRAADPSVIRSALGRRGR